MPQMVLAKTLSELLDPSIIDIYIFTDYKTDVL